MQHARIMMTHHTYHFPIVPHHWIAHWNENKDSGEYQQSDDATIACIANSLVVEAAGFFLLQSNISAIHVTL